MSNAEHTAEPSMEDILSSIRKIIAEEPATGDPAEAHAVGENSAQSDVAGSVVSNNLASDMHDPATGQPQTQSAPPVAAVAPAVAAAPVAQPDPAQSAFNRQDAAHAPGLNAPEPAPAPELAVATAAPSAPVDNAAANLTSFDALVRASHQNAPPAVAPDHPADTVAAGLANVQPNLDADAVNAEPEDLDPLSSLINQVPDVGSAVPADTVHAGVPAPVLGVDHNAVAALDAVANNGDGADQSQDFGKPQMPDFASARASEPQTADVAGFVAPKPAELRGALTDRLVPNGADQEPLAATTPGVEPAQIGDVASTKPASPGADDQPLGDLLKSLAVGQNAPSGVGAGTPPDHDPAAADQMLSNDDAQAAVDASTKLSREKLGETLTALHDTGANHDTSTGHDNAASPAQFNAPDDSAASPVELDVDMAALSAGLAVGTVAGAASQDTTISEATISEPLDSSAPLELVADQDDVARSDDNQIAEHGTANEACDAPETLEPLRSLLGNMAQNDAPATPDILHAPAEVSAPLVVAAPAVSETGAPSMLSSAELHSAGFGNGTLEGLEPAPQDAASHEPLQTGPVQDPPIGSQPDSDGSGEHIDGDPRDTITSTDAAPSLDEALSPADQPTAAASLVSAPAVTSTEIAPTNADALVPGGVRTMEDTVSELLRPMLRNWLDDNMPRILEKTLKMELAAAIEPDVDGVSSKPDDKE